MWHTHIPLYDFDLLCFFCREGQIIKSKENNTKKLTAIIAFRIQFWFWGGKPVPRCSSMSAILRLAINTSTRFPRSAVVRLHRLCFSFSAALPLSRWKTPLFFLLHGFVRSSFEPRFRPNQPYLFNLFDIMTSGSQQTLVAMAICVTIKALLVYFICIFSSRTFLSNTRSRPLLSGFPFNSDYRQSICIQV